MKRLIFALVAILFVQQSMAQGLTGDSWASAKKNKQANIVITYTEAAKFAEKINGNYSGVCFEIMDDFVAFINNEYGVKLNVTYQDLSSPQDFDLFLKTIKVSKGGVFGLGDVTITSARKKMYNFSPSYFSNVALLLTNNAAPTLTSIQKISSDFAGMTAVVQNGTTHEKRMQDLKSKYFPALKIETTITFDEANKKVASDKNYFTYVDFSTYMNTLDQKLNLERQSAGDQKGENFGLLMPKNSDWSTPMSAFFTSNGGYTNSVVYRKILANNLGNTVLRLLDAMNQ